MPINIPDLKFKIIEYVKLNGPSLPVQLSKQIGSNILFAGAVLSELVANQKLKISNAKVGGSPVYYIPGQESRLNMLYSHLHEREKRVYDLLKNNLVLHDNSLEPWERVALRDLKDFAVAFQTNNEIFWRWYQFSEEEAQKAIEDFNKKPEEPKLPEKVPEVVKEEIQKVESEVIPEVPKIIEKVRENVEEIKEEIKIETKEIEVEQKIEEKKIKKIRKSKKDSNEFYSILNDYLMDKEIEKIEENIIKKDKEFELIANVPSNLGLIKFFIVAKDKKRISDSDLSLIHNKAQLKKLPLILVSNGELTKQAKEYIQNNYLIFEKLSD